jgi:hypothetical protein
VSDTDDVYAAAQAAEEVENRGCCWHAC